MAVILILSTFAPMKTIILSEGVSLSEPSVATIGVFDGVHRGHQLVIGRVLEAARQTGMASVVVTFDRSPREVLDSSFCPQMLTTLAEKEAIIAELGVDYLVVTRLKHPDFHHNGSLFTEVFSNDEVTIYNYD